MDKLPLLGYIYLFTLLIAFLSSLISFRLDLPFHFKFFAYLMGLTLLVELTAVTLLYIVDGSSTQLYNAFVLIEFLAYGYFFSRLLPEKKYRWLFRLFFLIFPVIWAISTSAVFGFKKWNSYVMVAGSFFTIVCSLLVYYELLVAEQAKPLSSTPAFWFATAFLIGYLAVLPYYGSLNFLNDSFRKVAKRIYPLLLYFNIGMYLTFSIAFLCQIRLTKKS